MTALAKPVRVLTVYGRRGLGKGCSYSYSPSFLPFCSRHLLTSALFPIPEMLQNVQDERPDCSQGRNYKDDSFQHRRYLLYRSTARYRLASAAGHYSRCGRAILRRFKGRPLNSLMRNGLRVRQARRFDYGASEATLAGKSVGEWPRQRFALAHGQNAPPDVTITVLIQYGQ